MIQFYIFDTNKKNVTEIIKMKKVHTTERDKSFVLTWT